MTVDFDNFSNLPSSSDLKPTFDQFFGLAKSFVKTDEHKKTQLDWKGFQAVINNYNGDDLIIGGSNANTINLPTPDVSEMVTKLNKYISAVYNTTLDSEHQHKLSKNIQPVFHHLVEREEDGVKIKQNDWEYRFVTTSDGTEPNEFSATVVTVRFMGLIKESGTFWKKTKEENYSAAITSLKLDLVKGFKAPT